MAVPDLQDALAALRRQEIDAAVEDLARVVEELPAHPTAHLLLARAYEAQEQWDDALACWGNVRVLVPNSPAARAGVTRVLRQMDPTATPAAPPPLPDLPDGTGPEDTETEPEAADEDEASAGAGASPELEALRRHAEKEARKGGARPDLAASPDAPLEDEPGSARTPEEHVEALNTGASDDLDRLIRELESARIEPSPDVEDAPEPDLEDDADDLVSETLARIYEGQGQYREAARVYEKLASQEPEREREFLKRASKMREEASDPDEE